MKRSLRSLLLVWIVFCGGAFAQDDGYAIQSLNTPDPIFTAGDTVALRVSAQSSQAAQRAVVRLNGHDVTSALAETAPGVLEGTVLGLQPGINALEVFKNRGARRAVAGIRPP